MPRVGVTKVNKTKRMPIKMSITKESFAHLQVRLSRRNRCVSYRKVMAAERKKMTMLIQSGDVPITPL